LNPLQTVLFIAGLVLLVFGADVLVKGAAGLARRFGVSPLVVGLTVVAFGTSAPELAVSVQSALAGKADIAVGNVVGSNIANVLLILGLSATITALTVAQQLVRLDVPLMIGASLLVLLLALDNAISLLDGLLLFGGAVAYTVFSIRKSRAETAAVRDEYAAEFGGPAEGAWPNIGRVVAGLVLLVLGSRWLVDGAVALAQAFGISDLVVGLTVVAVGTSLPEIATSVMASLKGERDIAVGNVVGSNIFNLLVVLGLGAMVAPGGIPVSDTALAFDIPVMIAVAVACLPIFFTGHLINRWEGLLFLGYYVAYTTYLILDASGHASLPLYSGMMVGFVLPLTVVTLGVIAWREWRARGTAP
jgi:cation:H+ antiporter